MKNTLPLFMGLLLSGSCMFSCAQAEGSKRIEKQIEVEQEGDETTVTISETENGITTKRVLSGEDAQSYLEKGHGETYAYTIQSGDDKDKVIVINEQKNADGEHEMIWISKEGSGMTEFHFESEKLTEELKELQKELDNLTKEEIAKQIDAMLAEQEQMIKETEEIKLRDEEMDVRVEVDEENGTVTIKRTMDGKSTEEVIEMHGENEGEQKIIIKKKKKNN